MTHYGVRRLVVINSGKYLYANVDLSTAVHLAAPNNRGKSTLVNALQFLYIDDFNKMKFGRRSHDDTRKHYFGDDRSYLIFECLTTSGTQCMLIRGLSSLRNGLFERYIYDGEFRDSDYLDDSEIRDFDTVRTGLADRHLARVKNSELWQVLAGSLPSNDGKPIPRLNILPIRRRDEYLAFRDVFVRLLSLSNADAHALRQLIIEAYAREVGERKIDVAAEYKDEFDRAERAEHQFNFIRSVADEIEQGQQLRLELGAIKEKVTDIAGPAWNDARRCHVVFESEQIRLNNDFERIERERLEVQEGKDKSLQTLGGLETTQRTIENEWTQLHDAHKTWSAYSAEFVMGMRENVERKAFEVAELVRRIEQSKVLDLDTLRRSVAGLTRQTGIDRKALEKWERTAAAELSRNGITDLELDSAFRVVNPELLRLIVGETLTIKDVTAAIARIRKLSKSVRGGIYEDEYLEMNVSEVEGPDTQATRDPEQLRHQLVLKRQELDQQTALLATAENQKKASAALDRIRGEYEECRDTLAEYDQYAKAWANRSELEGRLTASKESVTAAKRTTSEFETQLKSLAKNQQRIENELHALRERKSQLTAAVKDCRDLFERLGFDGLLSSHGKDWDDTSRPRALGQFVETLISRLSGVSGDLRKFDAGRLQLKALQDTIATKSRQFEMQERYFNDSDAEWNLLIETRDSLHQLEQATAKNWDALFTTLGARLNAIVTAVSRIKTAVERINRGLKAYHVSNLRAVQIMVEEEHDTYPAVEALASQGSLFQDRDSIDIAKKRLRQMIDRNETIDLESLFELRIRIQQKDETWHHASSLDEIGSTGTGMTAKAMIFIQLVRAIAENEKYRLHFYIDGLGELDDQNLEATAAMAISKGIIPITADPRLHLEPLAHPDVTVYSLGQDTNGRFYIDSYKTYHARRRQPVEVGHE